MFFNYTLKTFKTKLNEELLKGKKKQIFTHYVLTFNSLKNSIKCCGKNHYCLLYFNHEYYTFL